MMLQWFKFMLLILSYCSYNQPDCSLWMWLYYSWIPAHHEYLNIMITSASWISAHHAYLSIMHTLVPLYLFNDDIVIQIYYTAVKLLHCLSMMMWWFKFIVPVLLTRSCSGSKICFLLKVIALGQPTCSWSMWLFPIQMYYSFSMLLQWFKYIVLILSYFSW
jgi:hypothetical protein